MIALRSCLLLAAAAFVSARPTTTSAACEESSAAANSSSPSSPSGPPTASGPPSVPIAIAGKEADISIAFIALMLPEYDVVHVVNSAPTGRSEFVPLVNGEITIPVSQLGSNFNNPNPRIPKAIFIGGGFAPSEIEEMHSVKSLQKVPWLYPPTASREMGAVVPPTAQIVARVKQVFAEHGFVPGNVSHVEPGIWSF